MICARSLVTSGHNTWGVHSQHLTACDYGEQFHAAGSAVYQLAHVPTGYPAQHDGIVIDECNPPAWLPEQELTPAKLQAAAAAVPTGNIADQLLRAVQATLTDAAQAKTAHTGRALFDALDHRCSGHLAAWLGALCQDPEVTDPHSLARVDLISSTRTPHRSLRPYLPSCSRSCGWRWKDELARWQQPGVDWNSHLRIGRRAGGPEMALYLTSARRFGTPRSGALPPRALIDGTCDEELHALLF